MWLLADSNANSRLISHLIIREDHEQDGVNFPSQFSIDIAEFNLNSTIKFIRLNKSSNSYPISSSNIYVLDPVSQQPVIYKQSRDENAQEVCIHIFLLFFHRIYFYFILQNFEFYKQINGTGHATLIKNQKNKIGKFKLVS